MSHLQAVQSAYQEGGKEAATDYLNREASRCDSEINRIRSVAKGKDWTQYQRDTYVADRSAPVLLEMIDLELIRSRYIR